MAKKASTKRPKDKIYGNNIKQILTETEMSQQELADIVGTNRAHISQIITGKKRCISLSTASKIARALKRPIDEVFIVNEDDENAA